MPRFSSPTILSDDIRIIPGIEIPPDKLGVYKNKIKVVDLNNRGNFIPNVNGQGYSTRFSKSRSEERIEEEVSYDFANKVPAKRVNMWSGTTLSGVPVTG